MTLGQALLDGSVIYPKELELREDVQLPGAGAPGASCGSPVPMHCNHCGHHWIAESSCMLRTCPHCWRKWAYKEAKAAGLRMWAGSILRVGRRRGFRLLHAVVSFRIEEDGDPLTSYRKKAIKILKHHGLSGGIMIWHPFRQDDDKDYIPDGTVHFHVIALARSDVIPADATHDYVFKVIRDAKNGDYCGFRRARDIKACIFYLLTHAGILKGRHSATWYGELSYNMLSTGALENAYPDMFEAKDRMRRELCPKCKSEDVEPAWLMDWTGGYPNTVILYPP